MNARKNGLAQVDHLILVGLEVVAHLVLRDMLQKEGMRDHDVAVKLRALGEYTHFSLRFDLVIEVMCPALAIVLMATAQGVSSHLLVILVELAVANRACVAVFICTRVIDVRVFLDEILVELKPNLM